MHVLFCQDRNRLNSEPARASQRNVLAAAAGLARLGWMIAPLLAKPRPQTATPGAV